MTTRPWSIITPSLDGNPLLIRSYLISNTLYISFVRKCKNFKEINFLSLIKTRKVWSMKVFFAKFQFQTQRKCQNWNRVSNSSKNWNRVSNSTKNWRLFLNSKSHSQNTALLIWICNKVQGLLVYLILKVMVQLYW